MYRKGSVTYRNLISTEQVKITWDKLLYSIRNPMETKYIILKKQCHLKSMIYILCTYICQPVRLKHALYFISSSYFPYYKITLSCFLCFFLFLFNLLLLHPFPLGNAFNEEHFSHLTHSFKGEMLLLSTVCFVESFVCHRSIFIPMFAYSLKDLLIWIY